MGGAGCWAPRWVEVPEERQAGSQEAGPLAWSFWLLLLWAPRMGRGWWWGGRRGNKGISRGGGIVAAGEENRGGQRKGPVVGQEMRLPLEVPPCCPNVLAWGTPPQSRSDARGMPIMRDFPLSPEA